jgi:hypothetical protein
LLEDTVCLTLLNIGRNPSSGAEPFGLNFVPRRAGPLATGDQEFCAYLARCLRSPLGSYAGIGKAPEKVDERMSVTGKGGYFVGILRLKLRDELRQFCVGYAGVPVMHAMIWFMEKTQSHKPAQRSI